MKLPLSIARKLLLLCEDAILPASELKHSAIAELINEGIVLDHRQGRTKSRLSVPQPARFQAFLNNKWGISDLATYVTTLANDEATRAQLVQASNDSKLRSLRTFKGFLVNSYEPIPCTLNGQPFTIEPTKGTYQFMADFDQFHPNPDVVIVGLENAENFSEIRQMRPLFQGRRALFVSRYPQEQGRDLITWLKKIPNPYWHLGDYDFAGINIYYNEYKKHLGGKATFFVPENIEFLLRQFGNRSLYDHQKLHALEITEPAILHLITLIQEHKMGLEQEALLIGL